MYETKFLKFDINIIFFYMYYIIFNFYIFPKHKSETFRWNSE